MHRTDHTTKNYPVLRPTALRLRNPELRIRRSRQLPPAPLSARAAWKITLPFGTLGFATLLLFCFAHFSFCLCLYGLNADPVFVGLLWGALFADILELHAHSNLLNCLILHYHSLSIFPQPQFQDTMRLLAWSKWGWR